MADLDLTGAQQRLVHAATENNATAVARILEEVGACNFQNVVDGANGLVPTKQSAKEFTIVPSDHLSPAGEEIGVHKVTIFRNGFGLQESTLNLDLGSAFVPRCQDK